MLKLRVNQPWLRFIELGIKRVEGRAGSAVLFEHMVGKEVLFYNPDDESDCVRVIVNAVRHYDTLDEYLDAEGWKNVAPHLESHNDAVIAYIGFNVAKKVGMNALEVCVL